MLQLYNSQSRKKEVFAPRQAGKVAMYVCGITVYDYCHIGHARMMVAFDVIARWLRASGYELHYVRNITDIDDKIIKRAVEKGQTITELTNHFIDAMREDLTRLGVQAPNAEPRATEFIPQMLSIIGQLQIKQLAYQASNGDVNFSVRKFAPYGKLSGKSLDDMRAGERVVVDDSKLDPMDFVLWKSAKPDEPKEAQWSSPYGMGRPGWHIECSAMSTSLLGKSMDIHGGGADLQFPHHENEIAQSEGANDCILARYWMHNGFVRLDNEKMSKSLGNFFTIREVLKRYDAEVIRFFLLRAHYRSPINYSDVTVEDSRAGLLRLYTSLSPNWTQTNVAPDWTTASGLAFKAAMDDDFNTPIAVAVLFDLATELNKSRDAAIEKQLRSLANVLGLLTHTATHALQSGLLGSEPTNSENGQLTEDVVKAKIAARVAAKLAKDYAGADAIRKELLALGIALEDGAGGTTWRKA
jgi:cysteinyl-tRNA synthetase